MSKIPIACPSCQKRLRVLPKLDGKKAKCPRCENVFRIQIPLTAFESLEAPPSSQVETGQLDLMNANIGLPAAPTGQPVQQSAHLTPAQTYGTSNLKRKKRRRKKQQPAGENDWGSVGWGVGLLIVAFISAAMPGMDELGRGGRGITKLVATVLFMLGPYAPLLGILVGLGGIALIIYGLGRVPKVASFVGGGVVSLLLVTICGLSFVNAMGFLQLGRGGNSGGPPGIHQPGEFSHSATRFGDHEEQFNHAYETSKIAGRSIQNLKFLMPHDRNPLSNTPLEFGDLVGAKSDNGDMHYQITPIHGVAFAVDHIAHITFSLRDESSPLASSAEDGEAVHGFNLNFAGGQLAGIQPIFGKLDGESIKQSDLRDGEWLGQSTDEFETVTGKGSVVHGFVVFKENGFDIVGFQLVIKE